MKLIIRTITILFILIIGVFVSIYLVNTNIVIDEINRASYTSVLSVQEDLMNLIEIKDKTGEEYIYDYDDNLRAYFDNYVSQDSTYSLNIDGDEQKGIVYLKSSSNYPLVKDKNLLNIIDKQITTTLTVVKDKVPYKNTKWDPRKPQVLKTWEFDRPYQIESWHIDVLAKDTDPGAVVKKYKPEMTLTCFNQEKETIIGHINSITNPSDEESNIFIGEIEEGISCKCDRVELYAEKAPYSRMSTMTIGSTRNLSITYHKEDKEIKMYSRFINDVNDLDSSSIWLNDSNYKTVLEVYIKRKNERNN